MGRWEPDGASRLQRAAIELFADRGYAEVTVAEIAARAGLTKRTFFNHFPDKREVLFAGAESFEASIVGHLAQADPALSAIDAAIEALTLSGNELSGYREFALLRRDLIASSGELQERDLIKAAAMTSAITGGLQRRQVPTRTATVTARVAVTIFLTAYDDWIEDDSSDLPTLMQRALADTRDAVKRSARATRAVRAG